MALFPYNKIMSKIGRNKGPAESACEGKKKYSSPKQAQHDAKMINSRDRWSTAGAYFCTHCKYYHVGNNGLRRPHGKKRHSARA